MFQFQNVLMFLGICELQFGICQVVNVILRHSVRMMIVWRRHLGVLILGQLFVFRILLLFDLKLWKINKNISGIGIFCNLGSRLASGSYFCQLFVIK